MAERNTQKLFPCTHFLQRARKTLLSNKAVSTGSRVSRFPVLKERTIEKSDEMCVWGRGGGLGRLQKIKFMQGKVIEKEDRAKKK